MTVYTKSVGLKLLEWIINVTWNEDRLRFLLWASLESGVKNNVSCFYAVISSQSRIKLRDWAASQQGPSATLGQH